MSTEASLRSDERPDAPCDPAEVVAADGASVRFCAHGGHVLGWTPAGGQERLWLSRSTGCGPGAAIRGGVPVIWPQFAERGDGPRHGVARDRVWQVEEAGTGPDGAARVRLRLAAEASATPFGYAFTLSLEVRAEGSSLELRLQAVNDGPAPFACTAALHTYLRVSSTSTASVRGLDGLVAVPNDGGATWAVTGPLDVLGPVDVALAGTEDREVVVVDPVLGEVRLTGSGFGSRVVWNPGPGRAPGDVHAGGEAEFVCLEPARLEPVTLGPGDRWTGVEVLRAGPSRTAPG